VTHGHKRRIVGHSIHGQMTDDLAAEALPNAVAARDVNPGLIVQTDGSGKSRSQKLTSVITSNNQPAPRGQVGTSTYSPAIESFFALLPNDDPNRHRTWATTDQLRTEIVRRHASLDPTRPATADIDDNASANSPQTAHRIAQNHDTTY